VIHPSGWLLRGAVSRRRNGGVIINEHLLDALETRKHVDVLGKWFDFVHHDDVLDRLARPGRRPFCLLTFDDGKLQNFTETAPELERLGVPAAFYVVTRFTDDGEPLWFDDYEALVTALGRPPFGLERDTVKKLPHAVLVERLRRALDEHGVCADLESEEVRPMSWSDIRSLHERGFTIGAHGLRHATLPRETRAAALAEVSASIADVSRELGVPCRTFAFPNGNYTAELALCAHESGAETVMTTEPLWVDQGSDAWRLPRIQLFPGQSAARIEVKIALASSRLLQNPDGTGYVYRRINRAALAPLRTGASRAQRPRL
jgi:peptidoglycan/xylan/chitin deacetylase (PgdA/CDA1 family)